MKTLILTLFMALTATLFAQTKEFKGTLTEYSCGDDRCSLSMKKENGEWYEENITLEYTNGKPTINSQLQDLVVVDPSHPEYYILNPKYQDKKLTLTCKKQGLKYYVTKVDLDGKKEITANPDFPKATCKVYRDGTLEGICEGGKYYEIRSNGSKDETKYTVQKKDEFCKGNQCAKIKVKSDGSIVALILPNVTDENLWGKIQGDKILYRNRSGQLEDIKVTFKGDKTQAAILVVLFKFFN